MKAIAFIAVPSAALISWYIWSAHSGSVPVAPVTVLPTPTHTTIQTPVVYSTPAPYVAAKFPVRTEPTPLSPPTNVTFYQPSAPVNAYHFVAPPTPIPTPCGAGYAFGNSLCQ